MGVDREKMKQDLLNRTKESYDRKDGEQSQKHFDPDLDMPFWRPSVTKGKPHIIDIIPFVAGNMFPTKVQKPIKEGSYAYVLDLYVHKKVGPGKMVVVCPAKNYGNPCPICEEVEEQGRQGVEYEDIPFINKRQCTYNVLVMDDASTEEKGVQVWDVSYVYSEKAIAALAVSARDGGYIPFSNPDKQLGKSVAFDVASDKYKKITGHRFEPRDYDIPDSILDEAIQLDQMLKIYSYDELVRFFWGPDGKPEGGHRSADPDDGAKLPPRRSLRDGSGTAPAAQTDASVAGAAPGRTLKGTLKTPPTAVDACPIGGAWADDFDKYGECDACDVRQKCAEAADMKNYQASQEAKAPAAASTPPPVVPAAGARRTLLRRT